MEDSLRTQVIVGQTKKLNEKEKSILAEVTISRPYPFGQREIHYAKAEETEMVKLMVNAFLSTKVTFCNEMNAICEATGTSYDAVRELFRLDPRVGLSHDKITQEGGFGGRCLPKDLNGLIALAMDGEHYPAFLKEVYNSNVRFRKPADAEG